MRLVKVDQCYDDARLLWQLMLERPETANIAHKAMPTWDQHVQFVLSEPYEAWYLITTADTAGVVLGTIYLTRNDEIGLHLFRQFQRSGFGQLAMHELMKIHPRLRYLANIAPGNGPSQSFFAKQGFRLCQLTYELCDARSSSQS